LCTATSIPNISFAPNEAVIDVYGEDYLEYVFEDYFSDSEIVSKKDIIPLTNDIITKIQEVLAI